VRHERAERSVAASVGTRDRRERMGEDRRGGERHLEREAVGDPGDECRFARGGRIHHLEPIHDLVDVQPNVLPSFVPERDRLPRPNPADGVVERVHEHPSPELTVGDHVEPGVDLPAHSVADRVVLRYAQLARVPTTLRREHGGMSRLVEGVDRRSQPRRSQEAPDRLRARGRAGRPHGSHRTCVESGARNSQPRRTTGCSGSSRRFGSRSSRMSVETRARWRPNHAPRQKWFPIAKAR
jgi:hypothetical protein